MANRPIDMRLGIDGLFNLVRHSLNQEAFSGHLFLFLGTRRDRAKILFWDQGGFVLYYKRLERGRFKSPKVTPDQQAIELDKTELMMLLDGIDVALVKRKALWSKKNI